MVHEPAALEGTTFVQGLLLQSVKHEGGVSRAGDPPADDASGIGVDHEGHVDKAGPGRDIGEVADPICPFVKCLRGMASTLLQGSGCPKNLRSARTSLLGQGQP